MPKNNWNDDVRNSLVTLVSGGQTGLNYVNNSGLIPALAPFTGANITVSISGQATALLISGSPITVSGLNVVITASSPAFVASGTRIIVQPLLNSQVTGNFFAVGTSATQFPNVAAARHIIKLAMSGIVYIAGAPAMKSGQGLPLIGDPGVTGESLDLNVSNLNLLYGVAVASTVMTHLSFT
jgi:hypothetical protein